MEFQDDFTSQTDDKQLEVMRMGHKIDNNVLYVPQAVIACSKEVLFRILCKGLNLTSWLLAW